MTKFLNNSKSNAYWTEFTFYSLLYSVQTLYSLKYEYNSKFIVRYRSTDIIHYLLYFQFFTVFFTIRCLNLPKGGDTRPLRFSHTAERQTTDRQVTGNACHWHYHPFGYRYDIPLSTYEVVLKVVAGSGRISFRKEVINHQLGGINAVPLILILTLDKFLNGI